MGNGRRAPLRGWFVVLVVIVLALGLVLRRLPRSVPPELKMYVAGGIVAVFAGWLVIAAARGRR